MTKKQPKRAERPGVDRLGRTELHYAANEGRLQDVISLIHGGADLNAEDDNGFAPMHFAAQAGFLEVARFLLSNGAEIDAVDSNGNTPLHKAVFSCKGDGALILALRAAGADAFRENNYGVSPLSLARTIANFDIAQFFSDLS